MRDDNPLVNGAYLLKKFPGKGGWTYAEIPEVLQDKNNPFGWVSVSGSIDHFELRQYKLMPMGNGRLFLPVRAEIRKKIGKQAGDHVHVVLYADATPTTIPEEIMDCFSMEPAESLATFLSFTDGERRAYLGWIYDAKTEDTRAKRILQMMDRLKQKLKFYDSGKA